MNAGQSRVVAVTGGIASGKSAVTDRLHAHGIEVIDADLVSRELVQAGTEGLAAVVHRFGSAILQTDGQLDRRALRSIVFNDAKAKSDLEAILHPRVRAALRDRVGQARGNYVVLAIPLLVESGHYDWVDAVVVVDASRVTQLRRLMQRDGVDELQANRMIDAQATRAARLAKADWVIRNDADLQSLQQQVDVLHRKLLMRTSHAQHGIAH